MDRRLLSSVAVVLALGVACDVPVDDTRADKRLFPPRGVIRGTVTYVGPRPCSQGGHIVGNAVVLVFDRRNPPPPSGLATSAVNFVAVPGDELFANEPRSTGALTCPPGDGVVEASAPFTVAPLDAASYVVSAFYDRRGHFWPTFAFRNLPEAGDLGGGYVDLDAARQNPGDPVYRPVDVGIAQPSSDGSIPDFRIPASGFVADNVPVTIGNVVPFTRPYFYPRRVDDSGAETDSSERIGPPVRSPANDEADPLAVPILAIPQDIQVLAPPTNPSPQTLGAYQRGFPSLELVWSVARDELADATDPAQPFRLQVPPLPPDGAGGLLVFARGSSIPESPAIPDLWPQVVFLKLADDPRRAAGDPRDLVDPQSVVVQGTLEETLVTGRRPGPLVVLQGIALLDDSLARTIAGPVPPAATTSALRDHVTTMIRPAALCFPPPLPTETEPLPLPRVDRGGILVTPHMNGASADATETGDRPLFDPKRLGQAPLVRELRQGCLPMGRYAISLVYPTGQAWTVPNEIGGCAPAEGAVRVGDRTCAAKPRRVLLSQGSRAVVEIVGPNDAQACAKGAVPVECLPP
jgi:hypothetical protein